MVLWVHVWTHIVVVVLVAYFPLHFLWSLIYPEKRPRAYSEVLYARGQSLSSCVQTLAKNDLVHIVDGYMHEVLLYPRVSCKSSCVYPLPIITQSQRKNLPWNEFHVIISLPGNTEGATVLHLTWQWRRSSCVRRTYISVWG